MSIYEYDEEKHLRMEREQSYADGLEKGLEQGIIQEQFRLVQEMNKKGFPLEQISELIGIDKDQIAQWYKDNTKK